MFEDIKIIADQVGWPLAVALFFIIMGDKLGIMSIKVSNKKSLSYDEKIDKLTFIVTELNLKVARIEAILEERGK